MDVEFKDKRVALIETDNWAKTKLPAPVVMSARRKLILVRSAPDERTLRNWKSLHFEKLAGARSGEYSIRLNDQWRMTLVIANDLKPPKLTVLSIEDYH
jgi:proteic killer suppression protein